MRNDEKSNKNAKGIYIMCLSDSTVGAVSVLHLELTMMRRNVQRQQSIVEWDGVFIGRNIGRSGTSLTVYAPSATEWSSKDA